MKGKTIMRPFLLVMGPFSIRLGLRSSRRSDLTTEVISVFIVHIIGCGQFAKNDLAVNVYSPSSHTTSPFF